MKGLTVLSEILLAVTVIAITVILAMVASGAIGGQIQSIFQQQERGFVQEIDTYIQQVRTATGNIAITYNPSISKYSIRVQNQTLEIEVQDKINTYQPLIPVQNTEETISGSDKICFNKTGQSLKIQSGACGNEIDDDLCENGCGPNVCRPDLGEDCTNLGCNYPEDAEDPKASNHCNPDYDPAYMDEGDPTVGIGWINEGYIQAQDEGDRCENEWECGSGLQCSSGTGSQSHCCPSDKKWSGSSCVDKQEKFDLVYVPARYSSTSAFNSDVSTVHSYFVDKSPFRACSDPSDVINKTVIDPGTCGISSCDVRSDGCFSKIRQCVNDELGSGNWDKAVGLAEGSGPTISSGGMICGKADGIPSVVSVTYINSVCGVDTASHEVGHSFGLFHIDATGREGGACMGPNSADCSEPNKDEFLMSYSDLRDKFGPAGYNYMNEDVLKDYVEACS